MVRKNPKRNPHPRNLDYREFLEVVPWYPVPPKPPTNTDECKYIAAQFAPSKLSPSSLPRQYQKYRHSPRLKFVAISCRE